MTYFKTQGLSKHLVKLYLNFGIFSQYLISLAALPNFVETLFCIPVIDLSQTKGHVAKLIFSS